MQSVLEDFLARYNTNVKDKNTRLIELLKANRLLCDLDTVLQRIDKNKKLVLYGTEPATREIIQFLANRNINVDIICNDFKDGTEWEGFPLVHSDALTDIADEINIIITAFHYDRTIRLLAERGLEKSIIGVIGYLCLQLVNKDIVYKNADKVIKVYEMLSDIESQKNFINLVKFRLTGNYYNVISIADPLKLQYFDEGIVKLADNETFVDGGAFDGDTIERFLQYTEGKFNKIIAFEPEPESYSELAKNKLINGDTRIITKQAGLYKETTTIKFNSGNVVSSAISVNGDTTINVVRLDDFQDHDISFIKMDVEGAELDALEGAKRIIQQKKPLLAICIYHKLADLWEIPLCIKSLVPDYKIYIRHYTNKSMETVCYATLE